MKKTIAVLASLATLAACAQRPSQISPTYVSPAIYDGYSCSRLLSERREVLVKVNEITFDQANKATGDTVAVAVGVVLFTPALFLLAAGSDKESELASLKGNYDAVTKAALDKKCITQAQIDQEVAAAKEAEKQRRREERRAAGAEQDS